jgi:hypothetical protein
VPTLSIFSAIAVLLAAMLSTSAHADDSLFEQSNALRAITGDRTSTNNSDAALIAALPSGRVADSFVRLSSRTPLIWARYSPIAATGSIVVVKATSVNGVVRVVSTAFTPANGQRISSGGITGAVRYFSGVNPFSMFTGSGGANFENINMTAFLAAVGLAMRVEQASVAIVSYQTVTEQTNVLSESGLLIRSTDQQVTYTTGTRWLIGAPVEAGDRRAFVPSYRVLGCNELIDVRHRCVVSGHASFAPFDGEQLPEDRVHMAPYRAQTDLGNDIARVVSAFEASGSQIRQRVALAASWRNVVDGTTLNSSAQVSATGGASRAAGEGGALHRSQVASAMIVQSLQGRVANAEEFGYVAPGTMQTAANNQAFAAFVSAPLAEASGGIGTVSRTSNWQQQRDGLGVSVVSVKGRVVDPAKTPINPQ